MPRTPTSKPSEKSAGRSPRFRQIVDHLRSEIVGGGLPEHAALPSERAVAELHSVSRMTARRALEAVEAEGLAYSEERRGRFVSPQRLNYNISSMANFVADAEAEGMDLEIELIESRQTGADAGLAGVLSVPIGEVLDQRTRLFRNRGHAIFLETEFVIARHCHNLSGHGLPRPTTLLEQRYSPLGHSADIVIRMRPLLPDEAALLGLAPHQAGIEQEQVVRDEAGEPFCFSRQIWRGELAQFSAQAIVNR